MNPELAVLQSNKGPHLCSLIAIGCSRLDFSLAAAGPPPPPDLAIIAQPCCTARIRYRSEFNKTKSRRGALQSENNPNYNAPTIRVRSSTLKNLVISSFSRFHRRIWIPRRNITSVSVWSQFLTRGTMLITSIRMNWKISMYRSTTIDTTRLYGIRLFKTMWAGSKGRRKDNSGSVLRHPIGLFSFPSLRIVRIKADQLMTERTLQILDFHSGWSRSSRWLDDSLRISF